MQALLNSKTETKTFDKIKKIVVLSDTHIPVRAASIPEKLIKEFKNADLIIHAGDFQTIEIFNDLEKYGNLIAVYGNMDSDDVAKKLPEKVIVNIENDHKEFKIGVTHGIGAPDGIE